MLVIVANIQEKGKRGGKNNTRKGRGRVGQGWVAEIIMEVVVVFVV